VSLGQEQIETAARFVTVKNATDRPAVLAFNSSPPPIEIAWLFHDAAMAQMLTLCQQTT
jgi:hypothetical protein